MRQTPVPFCEQAVEIGQSYVTFAGASQRKESAKWKAACAIDESLKDYAWPPRGADAEKMSFKLQCDRHIVDYREPTEIELEESDERVLPQYLRHNLPLHLLKYNRSVWDEQIEVLKQDLKAEASPGVPHADIARRNDCYLKAEGKHFNAIVLDRVERILATPIEKLKGMTRIERLENNLMDPVRVFVKNEPHTVKKIKEGRVRLIMSVSLTDKMIEMLLNQHLKRLEIQNWRNIPSKPGIGFTDEDGHAIYQDVMECGLDMSYADISGWDWGTKQWQVVDRARCAIKLATQESADYSHLLIAKAYLETESIYQFSDGVLVAPTFKGIVNSGKFMTSCSNSFMRVRLADLIGSRKVLAMGDDTVENTVKDAIQKYLEYGVVCKEYLAVTDSFEFCSHFYGSKGCYALNKAKMIMNLLHQEPKTWDEHDGFLRGFKADMETHPEYTKVLQLLDDVGFNEVVGPQIIY